MITHDLLSRDVFTTGQVAKICKLSQQTIIRCFDEGQIAGFRIPESNHRRISKSQLIDFMEEFGLMLPDQWKSREKVLFYGNNKTLEKRISQCLDSGVKLIKVSNTFDLGYFLGRVTIILLEGCMVKETEVNLLEWLIEKQDQAGGSLRVALIDNNPPESAVRYIPQDKLKIELPNFINE